jgi:hypothetical protein
LAVADAISPQGGLAVVQVGGEVGEEGPGEGGEVAEVVIGCCRLQLAVAESQ